MQKSVKLRIANTDRFFHSIGTQSQFDTTLESIEGLEVFQSPYTELGCKPEQYIGYKYLFNGIDCLKEMIFLGTSTDNLSLFWIPSQKIFRTLSLRNINLIPCADTIENCVKINYFLIESKLLDLVLIEKSHFAHLSDRRIKDAEELKTILEADTGYKWVTAFENGKYTAGCYATDSKGVNSIATFSFYPKRQSTTILSV